MNDSHPNTLLRSATCHHYTPPDLVERARVVLGGRIELDPFSCATANRIVRAERFITKREDGFSCRWKADTALINPPSGRVGNRSAPRVAWDLAVSAIVEGYLGAAIFVVFNLAQLQSLQSRRGGHDPLNFVTCVPRSRICYFTRKKPHKMSARQRKQWAQWRMCEGDAPTHAGAIVGLDVDRRTFAQQFGSLGSITVPYIV